MEEKVFVLGDSISIQYGPYLEKMIEDKFSYDRKRGLKEAIEDLDSPRGANGGNSRDVLEFLNKEKSKGRLNYDIILLNCGLHDIKIDSSTKIISVPIDEYQKNLIKIFKLLKEKRIFTVWINTTPVDDKVHNTAIKEFMRFNSYVVKYNEKAKEIADKFKIPIIDLYSFVYKLDGVLYCDHVHYIDKIKRLQAAFIAGHIMMIEDKKRLM